MNVLVWQWGRRGAGPRFAADLAGGLRGQPGVHAMLSLSQQAELLQSATSPDCLLPFSTYSSFATASYRLLTAPLTIRPLVAALRPLRLDLAICAMPGPLDLVMSAALARLAIPFVVIVHDADKHPGDGFPLQMFLQRRLARRAAALVVLSRHVGARLTVQGLAGAHNLVTTTHPPFAFGPMPAPPRAHGGKLRLLFFGRLLPYKGLDLLAGAMRRLGPSDDIELRVIGSGPPSETLAALAALPGVTVENRWVPEAEVGALIAWADALVLSYREASQSGVAAAAIGAGRWVVATRVGGMVEQLAQEPMAWLCDPNEENLAQAIGALAKRSPATAPQRDAVLAWRHTAGSLLDDVQTIIRQSAERQPMKPIAKPAAAHKGFRTPPKLPLKTKA